jgi:hypothetical protein
MCVTKLVKVRKEMSNNLMRSRCQLDKFCLTYRNSISKWRHATGLGSSVSLRIAGATPFLHKNTRRKPIYSIVGVQLLERYIWIFREIWMKGRCFKPNACLNNEEHRGSVKGSWLLFWNRGISSLLSWLLHLSHFPLETEQRFMFGAGCGLPALLKHHSVWRKKLPSSDYALNPVRKSNKAVTDMKISNWGKSSFSLPKN